MATVKSTGVTNIESTPITIRDKKNGEIKVAIDKIALDTTAVDNADDNILICPIPSNAVILDVEILCDDLDAHATPTLATNIGLAYSGIGGEQYITGKASGDAVDVDCFATAATNLQAAVTSWTSVRFEADDIVDVTKEAWEVGALTSDPGGLFYIIFDLTTAAATAAAGDLVVKVTYI